jgi:phage gpG-like protein
MINLSVDASDAQALIDDLINKGEDLGPALVDIGELLVDSVHDNFHAQGRPEPWAERVNPEGDWPILMRTGNLYNSIHADIGDDTVTVGSDVDYADFLNEGTSKMVSRPFFLIQEPEDLDKIENILIQHFGL